MTRKPDLTKEQAKEVRELYAQSRDKNSPAYWNTRMLAHSFDVSQAVINAVINRTGAYAED
ncbi:hypothetical protein [Rhizobium sp. MHM7A]|uniref:hypothetical protein n=1 Tax=Rhizobium sp. MHM7A TaxID=2583233 RepID=UPI0011067E3F|nr:hypothetical protein [Rhizobium sp. MHM7A]TLX16062.1 hypothetical protein FFR93_01710 [Rhizobium sp. MHM7A]